MQQRFKLSLFLICCFLMQNTFADSSNKVLQTKNQLKLLDSKIAQLKKTIATAHDKRGTLNQELASTEKQISTGVQQLQNLQKDITGKRQLITKLQQQISDLNQKQQIQQTLLAKHLCTRYKMGNDEPIKLILTQSEPHTLTRLLTYYQYIIASRQHLIDEIKDTQQKLSDNQKDLEHQLASQRNVQEQIHTHQMQLEHDKNYRTAVLQTLDKEIQSQQQTLNEVEQNKLNLSRLLKTLALQSETITYPKQPFITMRHKLPKPLKLTNKIKIEPVNQGVAFIVEEGTPVFAVYPGKIVFSDWLNGYGLLLIIDHGQGFMTLYAHNQSIFKHKGNSVSQGEQIATTGHSGGIKQNGLYFEVRKNGKAVSPLDWLS